MSTVDTLDGPVAPAELELALDAAYYTDPEVFRREREAIFFNTWQFACHGSHVARPGDYLTFQILDQSLFVIRAKDGALRAFYNVCKHRAHELVTGQGNKTALTCPYHAWTYETDGRLRRAPNSDKVPGFDRAKICLSEVRLEDFCGFIFVNLDPDARPMAELYPVVEAELRAFLPGIDGLAPALRQTVEKASNWKVAVENYSECYHCRIAHPTFTAGVVKPQSYNILPQGYCLRHTAEAAPSVSYQAEGEGAYSSWYLWPTFSFQVYPGEVLNTYFWTPQSVGRTIAHREWFSPGGADSEALSELAAQDLETTVAEDLDLVAAVQRGLNSRGYRPGPLIIDPATGVNSEHSIAELKRWTLEALGELD